jgi:hypothetical protein
LVLPFEGLAIAYLGFFVFAAPFARVDRRHRVRTAILAAACIGAIILAVRLLPLGVRKWLPFLYLGLGYWIPVALVPPTRGGAFEAWLISSEEALGRFHVRLPRWLAYAAEIGYLACYPLLPVAFAVVWDAGSGGDMVRFWTSVLAAGYACYVTLPWLVSRPPRLLEPMFAATPSSLVTRATVAVLGRVSHQLNTFPSGHVAVSVAAAISAAKVWPAAGVVLGLIAAAVATGAVVGRYHFTLDVVLGAATGTLAVA